MSKRWIQEHRREAYTRKAKREGYRARSAFKLKQLDKRFHLLRPNGAVVDLGCAPGGWSQVLVERVGEGGVVLGVDLRHVRPMQGARFIRGNFTKEEVQERLVAKLQESGRTDVDVVVSDMAPDMSGNYDLDQARSVHLCDVALQFACQHLRSGGHFCCKVFEGQDFQEFRERVRASFRSVRTFHPPASRKSSSEVYLVAKGFRSKG